MSVSDAAADAAAEVMVRELFGRTCLVRDMHVEVARLVLAAAEPHRDTEAAPARDTASTLSSTAERAAERPGQRGSYRAPIPPRPVIRAFGFGRPQ